MTQFSFTLNPKLKAAALKKARKEGYSLSLVLNVFLKKYSKGDCVVSVDIADEPELSFEELFKSPRLVKAANNLSDYLQDKDL